MNRIVKTFNKLIEYKLAPQFGEVLLDCKLIGRNCGVGNYRYDLLFIFDKEYNNRGIQHESVLKTCDELFDWVDLTSMTDLSIVIMNKWGDNHHYSYFELMDEVCRSTSSYHFSELRNHSKYREYQEWKSNKAREDRMKRAWESEQNRMERITRNDFYQESKIVESRKKKFLFW